MFAHFSLSRSLYSCIKRCFAAPDILMTCCVKSTCGKDWSCIRIWSADWSWNRPVARRILWKESVALVERRLGCWLMGTWSASKEERDLGLDNVGAGYGLLWLPGRECEFGRKGNRRVSTWVTVSEEFFFGQRRKEKLRWDTGGSVMQLQGRGPCERACRGYLPIQ